MPIHDVTAEPELTERQLEVLTLLGAGMKAQAIAHRLGLSPRTVGKHLERIYRRLGAGDRLTAVLRAQHRGLIGTHRPVRSPALL
jgi:DNA-binding NarL/FixJ family response regulator